MKMEDSMFRELMEGTGLLYLLCKAGSYELVAVSREFTEAFPELKDRLTLGASAKYALDFFEAHTDKEMLEEQALLHLHDPERFYGTSRKYITVAGIPMIAFYALNMEREIRRERAKKEQLSKTIDEVKQISEAKTLLITRISRDIRTPLSTITGFAELIREEINPHGLAADYLRSISASSERAKRVIDEMLDIQLLEGKKVNLKTEVLEVRAFVNRLGTVLRPVVQERGLHFSCGVPNLITQAVWADRAALELIITKLVRNSLTCTPKGGAIEVEVTENVRRGEMATLTFTISDNGIGMEQAKVDELFGKGPIVQPEASYAAAIRLDTSVAMSYIKAMGGTINFESVVGRGTRVSITFAFPIAYSRKNEDPAETVDNARILVADDHALSRSIAEKMLTRAGYTVVCAEDGKDAVEKFIAADGGFSLILMDIRMPVLDGLSAARMIRELKLPNAKTVPILAMTASAFEEDIRNSLEAGMNEHLSKPINPRNLYEIVEKYIHPKR